MKKTLKIALSSALLLSASLAFASFSIADWKYERPLQNASGDFVKVELPVGMSANADFSDVRVVDQSKTEVPYLITRSVSSSSGLSPAQMLNNSSSDGKTSFVADAGRSGLIHTGVSITTSNDNFQRQVSVYASDTALPLSSREWQLVTNSGYIFKFTDATTGYRAAKTDVNFPANSSRYFKVVIGSGNEGALTAISTSLYGNVTFTHPTYEKTVAVTTANNAERKTTEVTLDLGHNYLTSSVTLDTYDQNYSRRVVVEAASTEDVTCTPPVPPNSDAQCAKQIKWHYVSDGYISSIKTSLFTGRSNTVTYPEQRAQYLRFSVVNNDNPPLSFAPKATVSGPAISIIFAPKQGASYTLYYGNPSAYTPTYDIKNIATYIEENKVASATLGEEALNSSYVPPKGPIVPFTESHKWLLNVLLVLVVVVLGVVSGWYLNHLHKKHPESDEVGNTTSAPSEAPEKPKWK